MTCVAEFKYFCRGKSRAVQISKNLQNFI